MKSVDIRVAEVVCNKKADTIKIPNPDTKTTYDSMVAFTEEIRRNDEVPHNWKYIHHEYFIVWHPNDENDNDGPGKAYIDLRIYYEVTQ